VTGTRRTCIDWTTAWRPNSRAPAVMISGFRIAIESSEVFSAPASRTACMSSSDLIPPGRLTTTGR
jgi:hypothetical protein